MVQRTLQPSIRKSFTGKGNHVFDQVNLSEQKSNYVFSYMPQCISVNSKTT